MNNLFEFDGINITVNPILLSITEFEKIWKRDKSKDKRKARKEFIYIYGMVSNEIDNIWKDYANLSKREKIIIDDLFNKETWVPDRLVTQALEKYKARYPKTPSEILLESAMKSMIKVKDFMDELDLNERDTQGRLIHNPKTILDTAKQSVKVYMDIKEVIDKIQSNKELNNDKLRGGAEEGFFENENIMEGLV